MARGWMYKNAMLNLVQHTMGPLGTTTLKIALLGATYNDELPDALRTHDAFSDLSAFEISGTGYTAGGETLTTVVVEEVDTDPLTEIKISADNVSWAGLTAEFRFAVIYEDTVANKLLLLIDFEDVMLVSNDTFAIEWDTTFGIATIGPVSMFF